MAKCAVKLTFPQDLIKQPVTFQMAKQFNIMPNIRRAKVTETVGELVLELEGAEENLERGVQYLREQGVQVAAIEGDVLEWRVGTVGPAGVEKARCRRWEATRSAMQPPGRGRAVGFSLLELVTALAILAVLMAIIFPAILRVREAGRRAVCMSSLRQIGVAFRLYLADWNDYFPNTNDPYLWMGRRWRWPLMPYLGQGGDRDPGDPDNPLHSVGTPGILIGPSDATAPRTWDGTSYGYSAAFYHDPGQINQMTTEDLWKWNRFPCVSQNEAAVQELLGHSSVTTTRRYTHMEADDLRQQVAGLPGNRFRA